MPGFSCVYRPCPTRSGDGKSLFKFPTEYKTAEIWAKATHRMDVLGKQKRAYKLCENHFESKYFSTAATARKRLHPDAIPTIFANTQPRFFKVDPEHREIKKVPKKRGVQSISKEEAVDPLRIDTPTIAMQTSSRLSLLKPAFKSSSTFKEEAVDPLRIDTPTIAMQTPSRLSSLEPAIKSSSTLKEEAVDPLRIDPPTIGSSTLIKEEVDDPLRIDPLTLAIQTPSPLKIKSKIKHQPRNIKKEKQDIYMVDFLECVVSS